MATSAINVQARTGNRVVIQIGGVVIGLMQNIRPNDDYGLDPVSGIGDIHVIEHVPTVARHSISASVVVLINDQLRKAGIFVENGDDALQGRVYDIIVQDKASGTVLVKYSGASYASGSIDIQKHAIVVSDANFMALDRTGTGF